MASNEYHREYYWQHKEKIDARHRAYYAKNRKKILAKNKEWQIANKERIHQRELQNAAKILRRQANQRYEIRQKILEKLGGSCARCGFSDWRALQIDHVNCDGYAQRKKYHYTAEYALILSLPKEELDKKYQLLCANCNWIKRFEHDKTKFYHRTNLKKEVIVPKQQKMRQWVE